MTFSRHSCGTLRSVNERDWPFANLSARTSRAFASPCSDNLAPGTRLRPRHSKESKLSRTAMEAPRPAVGPCMSERIQSTTSEAIGQRRIAAGVTVTRLPSGRMMASSRTRSLPPHPCGPVTSGTLGATAMASVSARRQAEGAGGPWRSSSGLATSVSLSVTAFSGRPGAPGGRGRGNGTLAQSDDAANARLADLVSLGGFGAASASPPEIISSASTIVAPAAQRKRSQGHFRPAPAALDCGPSFRNAVSISSTR